MIGASPFHSDMISSEASAIWSTPEEIVDLVGEAVEAVLVLRGAEFVVELAVEIDVDRDRAGLGQLHSAVGGRPLHFLAVPPDGLPDAPVGRGQPALAVGCAVGEAALEGLAIGEAKKAVALPSRRRASRPHRRGPSGA